MKEWYVYIVSNKAHTLYTGMTDDLPRRVAQHKNKTFENAFTARYTFDRLVYYEPAADQRAPRGARSRSRTGRGRNVWLSSRRRIPTGTI
jgi:predicted GIY-YIG superfamily endonuclease